MTISEELNNEFILMAKQIEENIKNNKSFSDDILLKLYGYYKQSVEGDCVTSSPQFWEIRAKTKWEAWNQHKGMKKEHAMKQYIKYAKLLLKI